MQDFCIVFFMAGSYKHFCCYCQNLRVGVELPPLAPGFVFFLFLLEWGAGECWWRGINPLPTFYGSISVSCINHPESPSKDLFSLTTRIFPKLDLLFLFYIRSFIVLCYTYPPSQYVSGMHESETNFNFKQNISKSLQEHPLAHLKGGSLTSVPYFIGCGSKCNSSRTGGNKSVNNRLLSAIESTLNLSMIERLSLLMTPTIFIQIQEFQAQILRRK